MLGDVTSERGRASRTPGVSGTPLVMGGGEPKARRGRWFSPQTRVPGPLLGFLLSCLCYFGENRL